MQYEKKVNILFYSILQIIERLIEAAAASLYFKKVPKILQRRSIIRKNSVVDKNALLKNRSTQSLLEMGRARTWPGPRVFLETRTFPGPFLEDPRHFFLARAIFFFLKC